MYLTKHTAFGASIGLLAGILGGSLIRVLLPFGVGLILLVLNRGLEHVFESRIGIIGGFLCAFASSPVFSFVKGPVANLLIFFNVFLLTAIGFIAGHLYENQTLVDDDSDSDD